jgi:excisionase family DNA binding protein
MNELETLRPSLGRSQRGRRLPDAWSTNEPDRMSDRLRAAVMELVEALRDEIAVEARPSEREPDRLLSIDEAARALGIGRSALYSEISARRIRSVKVGRRRLVPSSAISEVASGRS